MTWKGRKNNKVQCDRTGAIVHASDCRMTWDGLFVLKSAYYPRNPQDTNYPIKEGTAPAISRPIGEPEFIGPGKQWDDGRSWDEDPNEVWDQ